MRRRRLRAIGLVAALVSITSSCRVDSTVSVTVDAAGAGRVSVEVVADEAVVTAAPGLADDLRVDDAVAAGWSIDGPTATTEGGLRLVLSHDFRTIDEANVLLESVSGPNGPLGSLRLGRIATRDGGATISIDGVVQTSGSLEAFADPDVLALVGAAPYAGDLSAAGLTAAQAIGVRFVVATPGDVASGAVGAEVADGTLSWSVPLDGSALDLSTVIDVDPPSTTWERISRFALLGLVVWVLLAAGFIGFVASARRSRRRRRR